MINNTKLYIARYLFIALSLSVMIYIFWHSSQDAVASSNESKSFMHTIFSMFDSDFNKLDEAEQFRIMAKAERFVRKCAHFCIYAALGFFLYGAVKTWKMASSVRFAVTEGICIAYAISDEIHQVFVPGRAGRASDVLIDSAGALCGMAFLAAIFFLLSKFKKRRGS
jgi:VanZ family protein